ncbi:polyketide cyclase [Nocardioides mangrovicus]|uniref:Polyketide cyclase n=1 Tax=Nocardioides mangrovicus TaxID=2478913 RepID=A0A3L8P6A5_9ACTN|nr:SRPBCC family protein [Nocardioides mangrovicus]RLV50233.1 polyketide cyclase [Nocardioides mangrovicus]
MTTTDTQVQVSRTINASSDAVFDVLSNPHRHTELDGSGFVKGLVRGDRITATGQQFRMDMEGDHMGGEYETDNLVTAFDANKMIGWQTAPAGQEPPGWEWLWELHSTGSDSTDVTLTYDWSKVTDQGLLDKVGFPLVSEEQLDDSLNRLAEAVDA